MLRLLNEPVALGSPFYIERPNVEELIYQEIDNPGCLIRIKAPSKMGKSSLLLRVVDYVKNQNYRIVYLDFQQADEDNFTNLDKFLRWFCANIARQLKLVPNLDSYWDEEIGSKMNCSIYFQDYLLSELDSPLILALNEVNILFEYPKIARDFLALLRSWYEEAKQNSILKNLRIIIFQSTEVYINLNINQSPFNVGLAIQLPDFTVEQIQYLAQIHGLNWTLEMPQLFSLHKILGGHPYLVQLALYELAASPGKTLDNFLEKASTITGTFSSYLHSLLINLQKNPALAIAFKQVLDNRNGVELNYILAYKLESMGLVKLCGNKCEIYCELYRQYFRSQHLGNLTLENQLIKLQQENLELQHLVSTDSLTKLVNRRYFDMFLENTWQNLALEIAPLSLIICEVDYFDFFCESNGREAANYCLKKIARVIENWVKRPSFLYSRLGIIARYDYKRFAIILPKRNTIIAFKLAERIRKEVKKIGILHNYNYVGFPAKTVTISSGVASIIPTSEMNVNILVDAANEALNHSKRNERDCTYVSSNINWQ